MESAKTNILHGRGTSSGYLQDVLRKSVPYGKFLEFETTNCVDRLDYNSQSVSQSELRSGRGRDLIPMDGPGTVTWEEFLENAERFLVVSDKISDGWKLYGDKDIPGQAYLVRRAKCFVPSDTTARKDCSTDDDNDTQELQVRFRQDPHEAVSTSEMPFIIEHHILWSISYSVPVLFFNGWKSDFPGINPVSVNEAQTVHGYKLNYTELSQAIHPIIGTPFLQLHPCLSQGLLRTMSKSKNKLVSWLSCVASTALNLKIHPEYFKLTH
ncbi:ATG10 enzyme, partial [Acromyrmex heyeri]